VARQETSPADGKALLVRADSDASIGSGHVMRCLALAQVWQEGGGRATYLTTENPALRARLESEGIDVVYLSDEPGSAGDAAQAVRLAGELNAAWVLADGYHLGGDYQKAVKDAGLRLICVDDHGHAGHYSCDIVWNQNVYAREDFYASREPHTRLLLGTGYVVLRREFWPWRAWRREVPDVARKVLVTLGGSDPGNATMRVIQALRHAKLEHLEAVVVAGPANPHYEELAAAVARWAVPVRLERSVADMSKLMAWADVAVSGGGGTCLEMAMLGLPNLVLVVAENQVINAEVLQEKGVAIYLGWADQVPEDRLADELRSIARDREARERISGKGRKLIDGRGGGRVLDAMR